MKILLLAIMLTVTGCVTFPRHYTRYECTGKYEEIAKYTDTCISSTAHAAKQRDMERYITQCRANAMAILCERKSYFKRHSIPFGPAREMPCEKASTAAEHFVCQTGQ